MCAELLDDSVECFRGRHHSSGTTATASAAVSPCRQQTMDCNMCHAESSRAWSCQRGPAQTTAIRVDRLPCLPRDALCWPSILCQVMVRIRLDAATDPGKAAVIVSTMKAY